MVLKKNVKKLKDWRECKECIQPRENIKDEPDRLWRGLNPYNFTPLLSKDVPRHLLCNRCDNCKKKFMSGLEAYSTKGYQYFCEECTDAV